VKENNYSIKCKFPFNFVFKKNAIRNQKENEFRVYLFKIFAWQTVMQTSSAVMKTNSIWQININK